MRFRNLWQTTNGTRLRKLKICLMSGICGPSPQHRTTLEILSGKLRLCNIRQRGWFLVYRRGKDGINSKKPDLFQEKDIGCPKRICLHHIRIVGLPSIYQAKGLGLITRGTGWRA